FSVLLEFGVVSSGCLWRLGVNGRALVSIPSLEMTIVFLQRGPSPRGFRKQLLLGRVLPPRPGGGGGNGRDAKGKVLQHLLRALRGHVLTSAWYSREQPPNE